MAKRITAWTDKTMNPIDVQERINEYVEMVQWKIDTYWKRMNFTHAAPPVVESSYGNKYARIIYSDSGGGQRFVHTFINMINGDILKAGGWKAPAPNGVRGNIFEDDRGASVVNEHGSVYLKR